MGLLLGKERMTTEEAQCHEVVVEPTWSQLGADSPEVENVGEGSNKCFRSPGLEDQLSRSVLEKMRSTARMVTISPSTNIDTAVVEGDQVGKLQPTPSSQGTCKLIIDYFLATIFAKFLELIYS